MVGSPTAPAMLHPEDLAAWLVCTSCAFTLLPLLRRPAPRPLGWLIVLAGLFTLGLLHLLLPLPWLGGVAGGLWILLWLLPALASSQMRQALVAGDLNRGLRWARWLSRLHPWDDTRAQVNYVRFVILLDHGDLSAAEQHIATLAPCPLWQQRARLQWLRATAGWEQVMMACEQASHHCEHPLFAPLYLQALGETGDVDRMWSLYSRLPADQRSRPELRWMVAALGGNMALLAQVAARHPTLPEEARLFFRASALQASGQADRARELLLELAQSSKKRHADSAHERLKHPLPDRTSAQLTQGSHAAIAALTRQLADEHALATPQERRGFSWGTISLGAVLLGVYASSVPGGSSNVANLIDLGALVLPPELADGPLWYRVVAAGLLHFGPTHLLVNLVGLWVLGHQVERLWNSTALWLFFFTASIGAMGLSTLTMPATIDDPKVIVGASAGVMGLVGALFAFAAAGYFVAGNRLLARALNRIAAIVALQTLFDWLTPAVSIQLHLSGLVLGALAATPWALLRFRRTAALAPAQPTESRPPPDAA